LNKKRTKSIITASFLFVFAMVFALGAGMYKNTVSAERAQFEAKIPDKNNAPIVLDLAAQGMPKSLVQPGRVQIANGHGPTGILNNCKADLAVQVVLKGFPGDVELELAEVEYYEETFKLKDKLKPGESFKMELLAEVPKEYRDQLIAFSGEIQFVDPTDGMVLSSVPVYVVNSEYGDPYKQLDVQKRSGYGNHGGHH
jgi:hypothetical protein